jgi:outer membrane scaffolding protein for murein synthesis (MipA/OmpV family)
MHKRTALLLLLCGCLATFSAWGSESDYSLRLSASVAPFIGGDAGSGAGAPDYNDAFDAGKGIGAEFGYRLSDRFSVAAGAGYEKYSGDEHDGISFDSLKVIPVYVGAKYHFRPRAALWDVYARADAGAARLQSVDISFGELSEKYWNASWVGLFDVGAGVEYRLEELSLFAEVRARYMGDPDSALKPSSDADASWSLPLSVGVAYRF